MPNETIPEPEFMQVTLPCARHQQVTHTVVLEPRGDVHSAGYYMLYYTTSGYVPPHSDDDDTGPVRVLRQSAACQVDRLRLDPDHLTLLEDDGTQIYRVPLTGADPRPTPQQVRHFNARAATTTAQ